MELLTRDSIGLMRRRWDEAARENTYYYIATAAGSSEDSFIASGVYDARRLLADLPAFDPARATVLEIGCGIGRVLRAMRGQFAELYGIDISEEMIRRGRRWLRDYPTIRLLLTNDNSLGQFANESIDFVFSFITFQHIGERRLIEHYFAEAWRVLRPGGYFRFQTLRPLSTLDLFAARSRALISRLCGGTRDYFPGYVWKPAELKHAVRRCGFQRIRLQRAMSQPAGIDAPPYPPCPESIWCTARKGAHESDD